MRKSLEEKKRAYIDGLITARRGILSAAKALPPECLDEVFLGSWSVLDLLAHLAGWDDTNLHAIEEILGGKAPTFFQYADKDWASYNARLVAEYRRESFAAQLAELEESHGRLISYLESLPPEVIVDGKVRPENGRTITIRNLLRAEAGDESRHGEQIQAFLGQKGGR